MSHFSETRIIKDGKIILDVYSRWNGLYISDAYAEATTIIDLIKNLDSYDDMVNVLNNELSIPVDTDPQASRNQLKILDIKDYEKEYGKEFTGFYPDHGIQYDMDTKLYKLLGHGDFMSADSIIDMYHGHILPELIITEIEHPNFKTTEDFQMDEGNFNYFYNEILKGHNIILHNGKYTYYDPTSE